MSEKWDKYRPPTNMELVRKIEELENRIHLLELRQDAEDDLALEQSERA